MKILLAYYTRTGCTGKLAESIAMELKSRGHTVAIDRLAVEKRKSQWTKIVLFHQPTLMFPDFITFVSAVRNGVIRPIPLPDI